MPFLGDMPTGFRSVVVNPKRAAGRTVQGHRGHVAQINAREGGGFSIGQGGLNIERTIRIGKGDRDPCSGGRRSAERLPSRGSDAANLQ